MLTEFARYLATSAEQMAHIVCMTHGASIATTTTTIRGKTKTDYFSAFFCFRISQTPRPWENPFDT